MAGRFFRKLLSRSVVPADVREALAELARLMQERPTLAGPAGVLSDALPALYREPLAVPSLSLSAEHLSTKLASGMPLLRGEPLGFDVPALRRRMLHVCTAVSRHQIEKATKDLAEALRRGRLGEEELTHQVLAGRPQAVHARADGLGLDAGLLAGVLRLALFPVLSRVNETLAPFRAGVRWERGSCPTCGSGPLLGEFRGLEQTRFLRCGLCAAAWECPRLFCPGCGNRDHRRLGYFHVEGEEARCRAATCDACRGYVKMTTTLAALTGPRLLVADVATLHLDLAAADRGFAAPGPDEER